MPLFSNGLLLTDLPPSTKNVYLSYPYYKESASALCAQPAKVVGPVGLLYVGQREYAITVPQDKEIAVLGSDDATTCLVVALRHSGLGVTCLAHIDSPEVENDIISILSKIESLSLNHPDNRLQLHIVGGFDDDRGISEELTLSLLHCLHKQHVPVDLVTLCVGEMNTMTRGGVRWPLIYGLGIHVKSGDIFPATFSDKGPEMPLRSARHLTGSQQMLDIYECSVGLLRIGPFNYQPLRGVDLWLRESDQFILQHLSTSPQVEPPDFVAQMRATLKHIQEHPFPSITVFPGNRGHYYRKLETGEWIPVHY